MFAHSAPQRRLGGLLAFVAVTVGLMAGPLALPAHAEGTASTVVVDANLAKDGTLKVKETITFTGAVPADLSQKFETRRDVVGDRQYVQNLSDITAAVAGSPVTPQVDVDGRFTTVSLPTNSATEVIINYTVSGAVVNIDRGETALRWGLLQGLSAQVAVVHRHRPDPHPVQLHQVHRRWAQLRRALRLRRRRNRGLPGADLPRRTPR